MSNNIVIQAENLSKRYRIGAREPYKALRDSLAEVVQAPFRAGLGMLNGKRSSASAQRSDEYIWALKDVSFEIKQGEVVGIIGRNGAGKSTLLKILSRVTELTEGCVKIDGRVGSLLEVGTGFHPELTGGENIYLNGAILGMKKREIDRKFDEIVAFAEVEKFIDTPVKRYSSGMFMRLAFSVAAHLEPEILMVDEVLAVGDAAFQKKCLGKIGDVADKGRTVLFVSHNMAAVKSFCSRAFLLSEGNLDFSGPADQCVAYYLHAMCSGMPAEIETTRLSRPSIVRGNDSLRITRVKLDISTDRPILYTGQPIPLLMEFTVFQPLENVVFAWSVHSSDQVRLFECQSVGSLDAIEVLKPGSYRLRCVMSDNPLNPGWYTLHIGCRCPSKGLDYLPDVMAFRVDLEKGYRSLWLEAPTGFMRLSSRWTAPEKINHGP